MCIAPQFMNLLTFLVKALFGAVTWTRAMITKNSDIETQKEPTIVVHVCYHPNH
jgi:hypothetical protein